MAELNGVRDDALDRDRTASMADEGGAAGARMDLREQLASAPTHTEIRLRDRVWSWPGSRGKRLLWAAVAFGVAAAFGSLALRWRNAR